MLPVRRETLESQHFRILQIPVFAIFRVKHHKCPKVRELRMNVNTRAYFYDLHNSKKSANFAPANKS